MRPLNPDCLHNTALPTGSAVEPCRKGTARVSVLIKQVLVSSAADLAAAHWPG